MHGEHVLFLKFITKLLKCTKKIHFAVKVSIVRGAPTGQIKFHMKQGLVTFRPVAQTIFSTSCLPETILILFTEPKRQKRMEKREH